MWRPPAERAERATIARFARAVGREGDYGELWRWSVEDLEGFWGALWEFLDVETIWPNLIGPGRWHHDPGRKVVVASARDGASPRPLTRVSAAPMSQAIVKAACVAVLDQ